MFLDLANPEVPEAVAAGSLTNDTGAPGAAPRPPPAPAAVWNRLAGWLAGWLAGCTHVRPAGRRSRCAQAPKPCTHSTLPLLPSSPPRPPTPGVLSRAEWVKFYALFFNKDKQASEIFDGIKVGAGRACWCARAAAAPGWSRSLGRCLHRCWAPLGAGAGAGACTVLRATAAAVRPSPALPTRTTSTAGRVRGHQG